MKKNILLALLCLAPSIYGMQKMIVSKTDDIDESQLIDQSFENRVIKAIETGDVNEFIKLSNDSADRLSDVQDDQGRNVLRIAVDVEKPSSPILQFLIKLVDESELDALERAHDGLNALDRVHMRSNQDKNFKTQYGIWFHKLVDLTVKKTDSQEASESQEIDSHDPEEFDDIDFPANVGKRTLADAQILPDDLDMPEDLVESTTSTFGLGSVGLGSSYMVPQGAVADARPAFTTAAPAIKVTSEMKKSEQDLVKTQPKVTSEKEKAKEPKKQKLPAAKTIGKPSQKLSLFSSWKSKSLIMAVPAISVVAVMYFRQEYFRRKKLRQNAE